MRSPGLITYSTTYSLIHAASLVECWNSLLKAQLKYELRGNILKGWDVILQDTVYSLNQRPLWCCVPSRRIVRVKWDGRGVASFTTLPMTSYRKHACFLPCNSTLSKLRPWFPKWGYSCQGLWLGSH